MSDYSNLEDLLELQAMLDEYKENNKAQFFKPYPYQREFMKQRFAKNGAECKQRFLRAGNRVGKTFSMAAEMSYHLTGRYPEWWEGVRINESGYDYWCIGVDLSQCARVQQYELLGTMNIRELDGLGKQAVPKDAIILDDMEKDGSNVKQCSIRHVDGGTNRLWFFAAAQGQTKLMGSAVKYVWMDEEPPHRSMDIYSQAITRTATTEGYIVISATPEHGLTPLNKKFESNDDGLLYIQQAGMKDAHENIGGHLTQATIENLLAGWPEYQWKMRMEGHPIMGSGAVFPFEESEYTYDPKTLDRTGKMINCGLDFGNVDNKDPSTMVFTLLDTDTGIHYVDKEVVFDKSSEDRSAANMARYILNSEYPNVELIVPHDGGVDQVHDLAKAQIMRDHGINNIHKNKNPSDLDGGGNKSAIAVKPGLVKLEQMIREGKLKISTDCPQLLNEMRSYSYVQKGDGKTVPKGFNGDHVIDGMRLSVMGHLRYLHTSIDIARIVGASRWSEPMEIRWSRD